MKITLRDESINIEVGQKVVFYEYFLSNTNELKVRTDETYVDVIDEENNIVGFKNDVHSSTLDFYQHNFFGEKFFLSDNKENRLRFLKSKVEYCESKQKLIDRDIEAIHKLLERCTKDKEDIKAESDSMKKLIEQLS